MGSNILSVDSFFDNDENYHDAWSNEYNGTVADMLESAGLDSAIASICDESYVPDGAFWVGPGFDYTFFTIDIPSRAIPWDKG